MKTKKRKQVTLKVNVTTADGELLAGGSITVEYDLGYPVDATPNVNALQTAQREAANLYEDAARIALARAKENA